MTLSRLLLLSLFTLLSFSGVSLAQRPGPEFWRHVSCEPLEPRTKLEAFEGRYSTVLIKGFTRITTVEVRGIRVDAVDIRDMGGADEAKGVVVVLREGGDQPNEGRAYIDYEEIDAVLSNIDVISAVDETSTKLASFEARYRTLGDLRVSVFRQTQRGTAVTLSTGICDQVTQALSLDDLAKLRALIAEAKARLDSIK
jgi:hypothetical protein